MIIRQQYLVYSRHIKNQRTKMSDILETIVITGPFNWMVSRDLMNQIMGMSNILETVVIISPHNWLVGLKRHKESIQEGVRYSCDSCNYKATKLGILKRHRESIHEDVRYCCDSWDYKTTALGILKTPNPT